MNLPIWYTWHEIWKIKFYWKLKLEAHRWYFSFWQEEFNWQKNINSYLRLPVVFFKTSNWRNINYTGWHVGSVSSRFSLEINWDYPNKCDIFFTEWKWNTTKLLINYWDNSDWKWYLSFAATKDWLHNVHKFTIGVPISLHHLTKGFATRKCQMQNIISSG